MPSLHIHTPHLFQMELENDALVSECPEHWTIEP